MNKNVERIPFRLKDLLTVIGNKNTFLRVFYHGKEMDYNNDEEINTFKDYYVTNIEIGEDEDGNQPCLMITVDTNFEIIYLPNI